MRFDNRAYLYYALIGKGKKEELINYIFDLLGDFSIKPGSIEDHYEDSKIAHLKTNGLQLANKNFTCTEFTIDVMDYITIRGIWSNGANMELFINPFCNAYNEYKANFDFTIVDDGIYVFTDSEFCHHYSINSLHVPYYAYYDEEVLNCLKNVYKLSNKDIASRPYGYGTTSISNFKRYGFVPDVSSYIHSEELGYENINQLLIDLLNSKSLDEFKESLKNVDLEKIENEKDRNKNTR